jgi:hypothetical protein
VITLASRDISWVDLAIGMALLFGVFYVGPKVLMPALARWQTRRRGGLPPTPAGPWAAAIVAAMLAGFLVAVSWSSDLGRPALGPLLAGSLGVIAWMWWKSRRR